MKSKFNSKQETHSKLSKDDPDSPINKLDDYSLIYIFKNLPIVDRIKVERVSKNWQKIAKQSWGNLKELYLNPKQLGLRPFGKEHQIIKIGQYVITQILKRCGTYLVKIDYSSIKEVLDILLLVTKFCPNIQSIICPTLSLKDRSLLSRKFKNISELSLHHLNRHYSLDKTHKAMEKLFSKLKNLQVLDLSNSCITENYLLNLPLEKMKTIKIQSFTNNEGGVHVLKKCTNLSIFKCGSTTEHLISVLASSCSFLTELDLSCYYNHDVANIDDKLSTVFFKNKNLRYLRLYGFNTLSGKCFLQLNGNTIEKIILVSVYKIERDYLIQCFPNFIKMHTLNIFFINKDSLNCIAECISLCPVLKKISIKSLACTDENFIQLITSLKSLEELSIINDIFIIPEKSVITDKFCNYIGSNLLELKFLNLSGYDSISDLDLKSICKLIKLEILNISGLKNVTGLRLCQLLNLKILYCNYCSNLTNDSLISLLKSANNLELLDVRCCDKITNTLVNAAVDITMNRKSNIVLEIIVKSDDRIDINKISKVSNLLYINQIEKYKNKRKIKC